MIVSDQGSCSQFFTLQVTYWIWRQDIWQEDPAKYLNSKETPLYKKSNVFYGLQATRDAIRKEGYVILVEGYMDF